MRKSGFWVLGAGFWFAMLMVGLVGGRLGGVRAQAASLQSTGQQSQQGASNSHGYAQPDGENADPAVSHMQRVAQERENDERHKKMEADAERMVVLAAELKAAVDTTGKNELSVDVLRKAAEMEKLAHDVGQQMKQ